MSVEIPEVLRVVDPTGRVYYLGTLRPSEIKELTFVPVATRTQVPGMDAEFILNENERDGYQRAGDYARMGRIRDFLEKRNNALIPPVVLSARGGWTFKPKGGASSNFGSITADTLAAIIDGQHRLGGLWQLALTEEAGEQVKKKPVPFMAVEDMLLDEEKAEFVFINDNQKGVKKSLLAYLERDRVYWAQAAYALSEEDESVFKGRIDIQQKQDWVLILFKAASESIELLFDNSLRSIKSFHPDATGSVDAQPAMEYMLKYWRLVSECMPEFWSDMDLMPPVGTAKSKDRPGSKKFQYRLLEETGIRAMSRLGCTMFKAAWIDGMRAPAFDLIEKWLRSMASRETVRLVMQKPTDANELVRNDPMLRSYGKAGVQKIYQYLEAEFLNVMREP